MLSTSELADLGMWLRDRGFAVTSTQLIAAARVVNGSRQFASREALVPYLAPLFCSDARMQKRFAQEYGVWLGLMGLASVPVTMQDVATHTTHSLVPAPGEALPKRLAFLNGLQARHWLRAHMRVRWWVMAVFAFSFFALIVALLWRKNEELAIKPTPASASIAVVASGAAKTPVTTPQALQASLPTKLDPAAVVPETKPAPPQLDKPEPSLLTNPFFLATLAVILAWFFHLWATCWLIDDFSLFHSTLITTALFVLSRLFGNYLIITLVLWALLWWVTAKRRRHAFLRRLPADTPKVATLRLAIANKPLNHLSRQIKLLGPALRQRRYTHTREIDVAASIQATVRLGGIAAPVFGSKQEPEYLLLVDRASHHDHFAELADALLGALQAQGVWLACYQFSGDLQEMHPYPVSDDILHDGLQTLAQLAKRHGDARLIIFSDGAWLIDRCTGDVHDKVAQLHAWPRPLLLTPNARRTWAVREWLLAHAGLQILPMDEDGLAVLRHLYEARGVTPAVVDEAQQQLGPMFLHNQDLWLDRVAPPKAEVAALVQALKDDLGKAGFVWLAACAVYPEIHWGITLAIGESLHHQSGVRQDWQLAGRNQHADCLLQLARLPWLRHGFMPGWFRQALLAEIPAGAHELVKCELAILLQGLKQAQSGSTNDLQVHIQSTQGGRWRQIWQRWLSLRVPEAAQDKVFLSFMGSNAFTLQPAGMLRRWLYPQGLLLAGPRSGLVLLGLCLTAGLLLTIKEPVSNEGALASASTPAIIATVPQASAPEPSITQPVSVLSTVASGVATSADATASATPAPKPGTAAASLPASSTITGANAALVAQATPSPSAITNDVPGKIDVDSSAPSAAAILSCDICPKMVTIPAGSFMMGDAKSPWRDEKPVHQVTVASFALGQTEITQGQWRALMGNNPSRFKDCGDNCPVERVSWHDAQAYVKKLSEYTGQHYRLPSEAEWEYAARAGTRTAYPWGEQASHEQANYGKDTCCAGLALGRDKWVNTAPVASFPANAFGLHDMHGNVWEWVEDCWHGSYEGAPVDGSVWSKGCQIEHRLLRGGSWEGTPDVLRSACRIINHPSDRLSSVGFRVARTPP